MHHNTHLTPRLLASLTVLTTLSLVQSSCSAGDRTARTLEQAHRYYEAGELEKAEIEYKNVLQKDPANPDAISQLGILYHDQGRDGRAAAFLLKARELQPENLAVRLKLGLAHLAAGGRKDARDEAVFVLERRPTDEQAPLLLVEASATPKELEDARQRLLALPSPAASGVPAVVAAGNIALRLNRLDEAEAAFKKALAIDPKSAAAHGSLGLLHWSRKNVAATDAAFKQSADLSPPRSPKRLHYAQFKIQVGEVDAARQLLDELTRQTPDYIPAWILRAEVAINEKKLDESDAFIAKALAREPMHPEALLLNARIRLAKGESAKAVDELERLLTTFPSSPQVAYQLGLAHVANGDTTKALARLTQAVAAAPNLTQAVVTLAELHLRNRDFTAAIATLKPLVQQHPEMVPARLLLAEAHRGQGNLDEAAAAYTQLEQQLPQNAQVAYARGTVLLQQNKLAEARTEFTRARELQPDHLGALEQLVAFDLRDKQPETAKKRVEAALAQNPRALQLPLLLARICIIQSDTAGAEAALKQAIELQPDSTAALYELARLYVSSNQQAKAIASLQETARANPKNLASHLLLAVLLDDQKDHAGARDIYEKALAIDPKSSLALNNLAYLYSERFDEPDKALEMAQRARTLLPNEPRAADTLGWILTKKKQYPQALGLLQESATKLPNEPEVLYHLGVTQYMLGQEAAAQTTLRRALELNPAISAAADARQRLARLDLSAAKATADDRARLEKHVADMPDDPVARLRLADIIRLGGDADRALPHYKAILQTNPKHPAALINIAHVYAAKKDFAKALESANAARAAAPADTTITHTVARLAYDMGDHRWSASLLQELARNRADDAEVLFDWAEAAYSVGRVSDAETSMRRALELNPALPRAADARRFLELLALCARPADAVLADAKVKQIVAAHPNNAPALMALALIQEQKPDPKAASQAYEQLLAKYPEFSPAQKNLTMLYAADPVDAPKAASLATKARLAFPNDTEVARAVGIIAFRQGDFAKALNLLQQSASQGKQDGETLYYIGMAQWRLNKRVEGRRSLERALELGLKDTLATEARRNLSSS